MKPSDYYQATQDRTADWGSADRPRQFAVTGLDRRAPDSPCSATVSGNALHLLTQLRRLPSGGRLLDIGCQAGDFLRAIRGFAFDSLYGLDLGNYSSYWQDVPGVEFVVHDVDAAPLPWPASHFHVVSCANVLEHVFDVFGLVEEIGRVLAPGGYAVVDVPNAGYVKHIWTLMRGRVPRTGAQEFPFSRSQGWDGQHLHYFTLPDIRWLLQQFGLVPVFVDTSGRFRWPRRLSPSLLYASLTITAQKVPSQR